MSDDQPADRLKDLEEEFMAMRVMIIHILGFLQVRHGAAAVSMIMAEAFRTAELLELSGDTIFQIGGDKIRQKLEVYRQALRGDGLV